MRINGVSWTPGAAGIVAVSLLGAGVQAWLAAPLAAAVAVGFVVAAQRSARRCAAGAARAQVAALQRALARRNEHMAKTVHELRTPLCTVVAALDLLRDAPGPGRREDDEALADATVAAGHLTHLVDDVLDEAALTAGHLRLSLGSHRVQDLLAAGTRLLRLQAERRGVRLDVADADPGLAVRTDPRRFLQVVCNLVGNALKVSAEGGAVELRVEAERQRVRFVVADRGPGVGRDLQGRLFLPFATGADAAGTGLGLHVSMQLVQQMGGRIGHTAQERGAAFWFELPRAALRTGPHITLQRWPARLDDARMRRLAAALLTVAAVAPVAAAPGQQQPFVARNGTFQIELPPTWRELSPGESRTIADLPGAPAELGFVQPRLFYAVGPVDEWLQGRFDGPWLWVVEQDNEWVVEDDFAERLATMWREKGATAGVEYEVTEARRDAVGPQHHAVLTAVRSSVPQQGVARRSFDVYAPTGGRQVSLSFTCRADQWQRWQPEFRRWLATVRFARPSHGTPQLSDRLWTPLLAGAVVTILLVLLYKHTHRQR